MSDPTSTTQPDSRSWWTKVDDWSREIFVTTRRAVIGAIVVVCAAVGVGLFWTSSIDQRQRHSAEIDLIVSEYAAKVRAYDLEVTGRAVCLAGVKQLELNRGQWEFLQSILGALGEVADEFGRTLDDGPLLSAEPPDPNSCGPEPVQPMVPPELR
jgi:hypothetical protein